MLESSAHTWRVNRRQKKRKRLAKYAEKEDSPGQCPVDLDLCSRSVKFHPSSTPLLISAQFSAPLYLVSAETHPWNSVLSSALGCFLLQMGPPVIIYSSDQHKRLYSSGLALKGSPGKYNNEHHHLDLGSPNADYETRFHVQSLVRRYSQKALLGE